MSYCSNSEYWPLSFQHREASLKYYKSMLVSRAHQDLKKEEWKEQEKRRDRN